MRPCHLPRPGRYAKIALLLAGTLPLATNAASLDVVDMSAGTSTVHTIVNGEAYHQISSPHTGTDAQSAEFPGLTFSALTGRIGGSTAAPGASYSYAGSFLLEVLGTQTAGFQIHTELSVAAQAAVSYSSPIIKDYWDITSGLYAAVQTEAFSAVQFSTDVPFAAFQLTSVIAGQPTTSEIVFADANGLFSVSQDIVSAVATTTLPPDQNLSGTVSLTSDVYVERAAAIDEPTPVGLMALGLAALAILKRLRGCSSDAARGVGPQ